MTSEILGVFVESGSFLFLIFMPSVGSYAVQPFQLPHNRFVGKVQRRGDSAKSLVRHTDYTSTEIQNLGVCEKCPSG
jgi:hypothetical protein